MYLFRVQTFKFRFYLSPGKVDTNAACNYYSLGYVHQVLITFGLTGLEYEVYTTLPYITSTWNRTENLLILCPMPHRLCHVLKSSYWKWEELSYAFSTSFTVIRLVSPQLTNHTNELLQVSKQGIFFFIVTYLLMTAA